MHVCQEQDQGPPPRTQRAKLVGGVVCAVGRRATGDGDAPALKEAMCLAQALRSASEPSEKLIAQAARMGNSTNAGAPDVHKLLEALAARGLVSESQKNTIARHYMYAVH